MIYAINKRTKEHSIVSNAKTGVNPGFTNSIFDSFYYVEADADGWIEWHGGECPLPDGAPYEERDRLGHITKLSHPEMNEKHWEHRSGDDDTLAYRPILDTSTEKLDGGMSRYENAYRRLAEIEALEWDGPCVGEIVGYPLGSGMIRLLADANGMVIIQEKGEYKRVHINDLHPLRSEEDKAVDDMLALVHESGCWQFSAYDARALYRAGYRKVTNEI